MRISKTQILILFCTVIVNTAFGQRTINLKIDTSCFISNELPGINGTLGLYTNIGEHLDSLVQEIEILSDQKIVIESADDRLSSFKFVFTPTDTLLSKNQYIVDFYANNAYLSCYFFNLSYPSFIDQLEENDTLLITSKYIGNTGPLTPLTIHFLKIWRFENNYYASFATRERYPNQILPQNDLKDPFGDSILLTKKNLKAIKAFEVDIENLVDNQYNLHHENTLTNIEIGDKSISLYSRGYLSLMIWNELKKTTANKK